MVEQREFSFSLSKVYFEKGNIFLEVIKLTLNIEKHPRFERSLLGQLEV
jgi:hypothetical protein